VATALLTTGSTSAPSLLAAASVTDAIAIPAMPITPPPKAARANRPDEVQEDEAREQH